MVVGATGDHSDPFVLHRGCHRSRIRHDLVGVLVELGLGGFPEAHCLGRYL